MEFQFKTKPNPGGVCEWVSVYEQAYSKLYGDSQKSKGS